MTFKIKPIVIRGQDKTKAAFASATRNVNQLNRSATRMSGSMNKNRRTIQMAGMQISDFSVQVAGGQSAILAMTQNLPQFVQGFGAVGGVMAAAITIGGSLWLTMSRAGGALNDITPILGILEQDFDKVINSMRAFGEMMINFANLIVNNLDYILVTATVVAVFFLGKWVKSLTVAAVANVAFGGSMATMARYTRMFGVVAAVARTATLGFSAALSVLRGIFMTLLPIAVLVGIGWLVTIFLKLRKATGSWGAVLGLVKEVILDFAVKASYAMKGVGEAFYVAGNALRLGLLGMLNKGLSVYEKFINKSREFGAALIQAFEHDRTIESIMADFGEPFKAEMVELTDAIDSTRGSMALMAEMFKMAGTPSAGLQKIKDLLAELADQEIDVRDWFKGMGGKDGGGPLDIVKNRLKSIKEMVESLATSISKSVGDAFMSMVDGTKSAKDAFRDMARDIIKQLFDILVVQRMVANLAQILGGNIGSGGGVIGSILGGLFGGGGAVTSGVMGAPMMRALGGPVSGGNSYIVGERGPELFTPARGGSITPNNAMGGGGGGATIVNQTINITTGVQQTVRAEVMQLMPQIANAAKGAVLDAKRRGGSFASAF